MRSTKLFLLGHLLREHGRYIGLDLILIAVVDGSIVWPPESMLEGVIHGSFITTVLVRAYLAWRDRLYAPQKINTFWHRQGRDESTQTINKVTSTYGLEPAEQVARFEGGLGTALPHARLDLPARCRGSVARSAVRSRMQAGSRRPLPRSAWYAPATSWQRIARSVFSGRAKSTAPRRFPCCL